MAIAKEVKQSQDKRDCHALRPEHHAVQGFGLAMTIQCKDI